MGLETATFISGLNVAWPLAGDTKSQGDDHLRLIKGVLTSTFPNATKPFYLPSWESSTIPMTLDASDQNNLIGIDVTSGDVAVTLPNSLTASDKGWSCEILKYNGATTNGIMVSGAANIAISTGVSATSLATIRIERFYEPVRFVWTGSGWLAIKPGPPVGSTMDWDGPTIPSGYRINDGTTYSSTTFAELNAALGTTTLKDKRGRVEVGVDTGNVTMGSFAWGGAVTIGSLKGGGGSITLGTGNLPAYTPSGAMSGSINVTGNNFNPAYNLTSSSTGGGAFGFTYPTTTGSLTSSGSYTAWVGNAQGGSSSAVNITQPGVATYKITRVA